jgi:hypothetical protein
MARLPQTGCAVASLWERTPEIEEAIELGLVHPDDPFVQIEYVTSLPAVMSSLGLAPLSPEDERKVRESPGAAIGRGLQELGSSPTHNPDGKLQVCNVQKTLRRVARGVTKMARGRLDPAEMSEIDKPLRGRQTGFHDLHDTVAANEIVMSLTDVVGDRDKADAMMSDFANHPGKIAKACRLAIERLGRIKGKGGQPAIGWYTEFTAVLKTIAAANNIKPTISVSPWTLKAQGRFLDLAAAVEQLLPLAMRSPSDEARAQRLKRALKACR